MANSNKMKYEEMRSFSSASVTGTYQQLGAPLIAPSVILKIVNDSDQAVTLSTDGSTDHDICIENSSMLYDSSKYNDNSPNAAFPSGTQFYIKGTAGSGTIYLVSIYS